MQLTHRRLRRHWEISRYGAWWVGRYKVDIWTGYSKWICEYTYICIMSDCEDSKDKGTYYVFTCGFVCWSICEQDSAKLLNPISTKLEEGWVQEGNHYIFLPMWIKGQIQDFFFHFCLFYDKQNLIFFDISTRRTKLSYEGLFGFGGGMCSTEWHMYLNPVNDYFHTIKLPLSASNLSHFNLQAAVTCFQLLTSSLLISCTSDRHTPLTHQCGHVSPSLGLLHRAVASSPPM